MIKWFKKILGVEVTAKPVVLTDPIKMENEIKVTERPPAPEPTKPTTDRVEASKEKVKKAAVKTEPVTVKAKSSAPKKPKGETRNTLEKMTKVKIDELAQERFGVELDRRKTKEFMIDEFLIAQKKAK